MITDNVKRFEVSARQAGTRMIWCGRCGFAQTTADRMGLHSRGLSVDRHGLVHGARKAPGAMKINASVGHKPEMKPAATGDPGG
tara:strand:+ start:394 stop:645 length:252 start_codon:yes stop_codon:yes gene_type:complete